MLLLRALSTIKFNMWFPFIPMCCLMICLCSGLTSFLQLIFSLFSFGSVLAPGCWNSASLQILFIMNSNKRNTKILIWNIRGINSQGKWDALRGKIEESACHIICLQETKRESFDIFYLKKFCPRHLDKFCFFPSDGASGGLIIIWNSSVLDGVMVQANTYAITVNFHNRLDNKNFHLTNVYGPSVSSEKIAFITWLINLDTSSFDDWLLAGDFNLIRSAENRNKPGGDLGEM